MLTYCAYQGCVVKYIPFSKITFFSLPKDERRKIWIENSGNPQLQHISPTAIRFFCEHHFDPKYLKRQFHRTTLHKTAIPFKYKSSAIENERENIFIEETIEVNVPPAKKKAKSSVYVIVSSDGKNNEEQVKIKEQNIPINRIRNGQITATRNDLFCKNDQPEENEALTIQVNENAIEHDEYILQDSDTFDLEDSLDLDETSRKKYEEEYILNVENVSCKDSKDAKVSLKQEKAIESDDNLNYSKLICKQKFEKISKEKETLTNQERKLVSNIEENVISPETSDKHFALSLVEYFHKLPPRKKQIAKLKILEYLTELQYSNDVTIS